MVEVIFQLLQAGINLADDIIKTKYQDQYIKLKERYYEEFNKDPAQRSDAILDNVESELRILASSFAASVGKPNAPTQP